MNIFNLPDLGEGLPDAEIHAWFVKVGDMVNTDDPLVSMETAKAVVDVPCPQSGKIIKLYGNPGDIIKTGEPLVAFEAVATDKPQDKGTVVGNLEESKEITEDSFYAGASDNPPTRAKATPAVRMLAKKLGVELDLIKGSGDNGIVTKEDVEKFAKKEDKLEDGFEPLRGIRRAMLHSMEQSHQEVVAVSIFDEADIYQWEANADITVRLIRAIAQAAKMEPSLNAWFNTKQSARKIFDEVNLGLAMDSEEGLFVPVIHNVEQFSDEELRKKINSFKQTVNDRTIPAEDLKGATITLSNFGKFAGRFASPIIVPPMVAIIAVGKLYEGVVAKDGNVFCHKKIPLSLSFDHRAVTGGEATRFLGAVIAALEKS